MQDRKARSKKNRPRERSRRALTVSVGDAYTEAVERKRAENAEKMRKIAQAAKKS